MGSLWSSTPPLHSHQVLVLEEPARLMLFHAHDGKYEAYSLRALPDERVSLGYTPWGFCELDAVLRPHARSVSAAYGACGRYTLAQLQVPLGSGYNRLWWCTVESNHAVWAHGEEREYVCTS